MRQVWQSFREGEFEARFYGSEGGERLRREGRKEGSVSLLSLEGPRKNFSHM